MILYKYYSYDAGISALKNEKFGFRNPKEFNDPFELTSLSNFSGEKSVQMPRTIDALKKNIAVLSLTRTFDNPLMWAHYGQEHTGFVIGYEVAEPFLKSNHYNIVGVDQGNVVYTSTKTPLSLDEVLIERLHKIYQVSHGIDLDQLEKSERTEVENLLRRILLTKHSSWVYEEEVRVIKAPFSLLRTSEETNSDPFLRHSSISINVAPSYGLIAIPGLNLYDKQANIKEVYLGIRNPLSAKKQSKTEVIEVDSSLAEKASEKGWKIKRMVMEERSWGMKSVSVECEELIIKKSSEGLLNRFAFSGLEAEYLRAHLSRIQIDTNANFELTNWYGKPYLKINGSFLRPQNRE